MKNHICKLIKPKWQKSKRKTQTVDKLGVYLRRYNTFIVFRITTKKYVRTYRLTYRYCEATPEFCKSFVNKLKFKL